MEIKMNVSQLTTLRRALNYANNSHKAEILSAIAEGNVDGATRINRLIDRISDMRDMIFMPEGISVTAYQVELLVNTLQYAIQVRSAEADEAESEGDLEYAASARQAIESYTSLAGIICGSFPGV